MFIINTPTNYQLIEETETYQYLIPAYPFCPCKFNKLEQKCKELKERLPEDVVDVYVPSAEDVSAMPTEIKACGDLWWTSTAAPSGIYAYFVGMGGYILNRGVNISLGFRPVIVRRK